MNKLWRQSGPILVIVAVAIVALVGLAGLVVDVGRAYSDERSIQAAAEAGAHGGAFLLEKNWNGDTGNFGSLTDAQVRAAVQNFASYNGWEPANDPFYMDYVYADRTTHVATLDDSVRGVLVQLGKNQTATFARVLGFYIYNVFARATVMFGAALQAGAIPLAITDDCMGTPPQYYISVGAQPAESGGAIGTCNFGSVVPPDCVAGDVVCYQNAMQYGMRTPVKLGIPYPINAFDNVTLAPETAASLQWRIDLRPAETCTTFKSPSPRVVWMPVVPGGFGGSTLTFVRYRAFFLTSITPGLGFTGCFVKATIAGGDFDPNAVGTAYGGVMIMKLMRSTGAVVPTAVTIGVITSAATPGLVNGASLSIHTNPPGALCTVVVNDMPPAPGTPSHAGGLGPEYADGSGNVTWTWTLEPNALVGPARVQVTCTYHALLGFASTTLMTVSAGPGHLAPGSDPRVLPGPVLVADEDNNRLVEISPAGQVLWEFPRAGDLAPGQTFELPDDAFFSPDGKEIIVTQEENFTVTLIDWATHKIVWRYGQPGVHGSGPNRLWNPDDAMVLPNGDVVIADIMNCRIIVVAKGGQTVAHSYGRVGSCYHNPPMEFGSPNGAFPLQNGNWLVTEINGDWVSEIAPGGTVLWSTHPPSVAYPSDTNEIGPNRYLTVDYSSPGQVVIFDRSGRTIWRYRPTGALALNHPSLAVGLPNGDVMLNDDANHRVIVVDPRTDQVVWQYGMTGQSGSTPGLLNNPDGIDLAPPYSLLGTHAKTLSSP